MNSDQGRFAKKVVLVTGAAGGLGAVQARTFAREGATVIVGDISAQRGEAVAASIRDEGGDAYYAEIDVASAEGWRALSGRVRQELGALHVLINNAGIVSRTGISVISVQEWQSVLNINLTGTMLGIHTMAPLMRDSGGGSIVNISSTAGLIGHPGVAYSASKWGLRGVTKSAALDLLDWRIRVNSVHPAQVDGTLLTSAASPGWRRANERLIPAGRLATMDEVTKAVLFLASEDSSYINATEIVVDSGESSIGMPRVRSALAEEFNRALDIV